MVKVRTKVFDGSGETTADARWRSAELGGDLARVEPGDVPERDEGSVVRLERVQCSFEVDEVDEIARIAAAVRRIVDDRQVHDGVPAAPADSLACLVRGDQNWDTSAVESI
jgi:hypothetical protein